MTGAEARAGRKRLGLTSLRLSSLAGLPSSTVEEFERTGRMPAPMHGKQDRIAMLRAALEGAGAEFADDGNARDVAGKA